MYLDYFWRWLELKTNKFFYIIGYIKESQPGVNRAPTGRQIK